MFYKLTSLSPQKLLAILSWYMTYYLTSNPMEVADNSLMTVEMTYDL